MNQNENKPGPKPEAGERAIQLVDDAFRIVRLTKECGIPVYQDKDGLPADVAQHVPAGPNVDAVLVRTALMMLAIHYNMGGTEVVEMSRFAAWRLENKI